MTENLKATKGEAQSDIMTKETTVREEELTGEQIYFLLRLGI